MIKRNAQNDIEDELKHSPAIAILGARQVGKTTLAQAIAERMKKKSLYLDMEDARDESKLADAGSFLESHKEKCVIIDEVQRNPSLFATLRPLIDRHRVPGRFILLGSASPLLIKGVSESLAGRIHYTTLAPVNLAEAAKNNISQNTHWYRGGFPKALTASGNNRFHLWMDDYIRSFIEKDMSGIFEMKFPRQIIRNFLNMLAYNQGGIWNAQLYAGSLGITGPTVTKYLDYLEGAFIVFRLQPWFMNVEKRLVRSPKVYINDSGMLHRFLRISELEQLYGNPIIGQSWEGYVIQQVLQLKHRDLDAYYYRTQNGAECDIVLVKGLTPLACIEIKFSNAPVLSRGFYSCIEDLKTKNNFVITPESDTYSPKKNIKVCSLRDFFKKQLPEII